MTPKYNSAQDVIDVLPDIAEEAINGSGCSFEVYVSRLSRLVDEAVARLSNADKALVRSVAAQRFDYATPDELAAQEAELHAEGYCSHGLTEDTCPCGCFEHYDESDFAGDSEPELDFEQALEILVLEAKIETCQMAIDALVPLAEDCPEASCRLEDAAGRLVSLNDKLHECC